MSYDGEENTAARKCRTCERGLPVAEFWRQPNKSDGLQSECKACMRVRTTAYHRAHRDTIRPRNNAVIAKRRKLDPVKHLLSIARSRAKSAGLSFTITADDLQFPSKCPVLGIPVYFGIGQGMRAGIAAKDGRYSIDRIDNRRGYVPGNVIVVSYRANRIKSDATAQEMSAVARFYERLEAEKGGQANLSAVQPSSPEENRAVPLSVGGR